MYSSLLGLIFYFYIYVSSSVLSCCSIKHDDDDDDREATFWCQKEVEKCNVASCNTTCSACDTRSSAVVLQSAVRFL